MFACVAVVAANQYTASLLLEIGRFGQYANWLLQPTVKEADAASRMIDKSEVRIVEHAFLFQ